jgi:hypothetical protein
MPRKGKVLVPGKGNKKPPSTRQGKGSTKGNRIAAKVVSALGHVTGTGGKNLDEQLSLRRSFKQGRKGLSGKSTTPAAEAIKRRQLSNRSAANKRKK